MLEVLLAIGIIIAGFMVGVLILITILFFTAKLITNWIDVLMDIFG